MTVKVKFIITHENGSKETLYRNLTTMQDCLRTAKNLRTTIRTARKVMFFSEPVGQAA